MDGVDARAQVVRRDLPDCAVHLPNRAHHPAHQQGAADGRQGQHARQDGEEAARRQPPREAGALQVGDTNQHRPFPRERLPGRFAVWGRLTPGVRSVACEDVPARAHHVDMDAVRLREGLQIEMFPLHAGEAVRDERGDAVQPFEADAAACQHPCRTPRRGRENQAEQRGVEGGGFKCDGPFHFPPARSVRRGGFGCFHF